MTEREKHLREQEKFLLELLHIHNINKELFSMPESEFQEYVDAVLDELNDIHAELKSLNNLKSLNDED
jgi:hypothetical protein